MDITIIENIDTGKLYRFSSSNKCFKLQKESGEYSKPETVYSPNFKTEFLIKTVLYKGEPINVGQKCSNIGTIIDIEKRNEDIVFIGTRASSSAEFLKIKIDNVVKKSSFNYRICD